MCLQEVDVAQQRSHGVHQPALAADAFGAREWGFAPTLAGTPSPWRTWHPLLPAVATGAALPTSPDRGTRGEESTSARATFGNALVSRAAVRAWHVLGLGQGRARLPVRAPDPTKGRHRWWSVPDEPRLALAAELDDVTVVTTHLSFSPATAVRQLRRMRGWASALPRPVVVAGDLNLPGAVAGPVLGGPGDGGYATYPAVAPRVRLDHVIPLDGVPAEHTQVRRLSVGDHLAVVLALVV